MEWLIGFIAAGFFHFIRFPGRIWRWFKFSKVTEDPLEGRWNGCHFSRRDGQAILRREVLSIRRTGNNEFDATFSAEKEYSGHLRKERGHVVISLDGTSGYQSHYDMRLEEPIPETKVMRGLWMSFDFDGRIIAGPAIFSREMLSDAEAIDYLNSSICVTHPDNCLLGLKEP